MTIWLPRRGFYDNQFTAEDVEQFHNMCREAVRAIGDKAMMRVGKAIYVSAHPSVAVAFEP
jgi:hypothetical protein